MGASAGQSTPGTQTVPGQTPQTEGIEPAPPAYPASLQRLLDRFPECSVPNWRFADGIPTAAVPPERLVEICRWLQREASPPYELIVDICAAHWPSRELPFEVSYIFHALEDNSRIRLKCSVGGEEPALPTISHLWPSANWPEREIYDMFGVTFEGHPDLRRLLTPNDWEGHALRKDFPLGEEPVEFYRMSSLPSGSYPSPEGTGAVSAEKGHDTAGQSARPN